MDCLNALSSNRFANKLVTAPTSQIVTLDEAKEHLRLGCEPHPDDAYVGLLINAATLATENFIRQRLSTQTWDTFFDAFPALGNIFLLHDLSPVQSITFIQYIDENNTTQTLSTDIYELDNASKPARIYEKDDQEWPDFLNIRNAVTIRSVVGYADASSVPEPIKQAIKIMIEGLYEHRSTVEPGVSIAEVPGQIAYEALLAPYRIT